VTALGEPFLDVLLSYDDEDVAAMTPDQLDRYLSDLDVAYAGEAQNVEADSGWWLRCLFPSYFGAPFAEHHYDLWRWVDSLQAGERQDSFVGVWPRGGAKSTCAEGATVHIAATRRRRYGLYVCDTQKQADDHVQNIATMLESRRVTIAYPELGERLVGKFGQTRGWRRNRLRTATGFTIDALGLDTAARGAKLDEERPDFMVFDDLDAEDDGPAITERKIADVTRKLLPAGSDALAVLAIQNMVIPTGIFARLAGITEEPAEFLARRTVSGPIPAVRDLTVDQVDGRFTIVGGEASWVGQSLDVCQAQIDEWGITAFRLEAQHETDALDGGMFGHLTFAHVRPEDVPPLTEVAVWVDPAVTTKDHSDSMAVQADGLANGTIYRLRSWEQVATPVTALKVAIAWAAVYGASRGIGIETDQGGDTWNSVYKEARQSVVDDLRAVRAGEPVEGPSVYVSALVEITTAEIALPAYRTPQQEKAGVTQQSKAGRASQMLASYERAGRIVHVLGTHQTLERALVRFPRTKPFDLVDAAFWAWRDLDRFGKPSTSSGRQMANRRLASPTLVATTSRLRGR
jgi:hypothetical protein